jgi:tRNA(adenine34) deaminase
MEAHQANMRLALAQAELAYDADEVPVGAVVVRQSDGTILATAQNERERTQDPTAHAEVVALRRAAAVLGSWRLDDCVLYVTMEPCPMCAGAIVQARVPVVVYGCTDRKAGACHTLYEITSDPRLNHRCEVIGGVLAEECAAILSHFFQSKRALGKK